MLWRYSAFKVTLWTGNNAKFVGKKKSDCTFAGLANGWLNKLNFARNSNVKGIY